MKQDTFCTAGTYPLDFGVPVPLGTTGGRRGISLFTETSRATVGVSSPRLGSVLQVPPGLLSLAAQIIGQFSVVLAELAEALWENPVIPALPKSVNPFTYRHLATSANHQRNKIQEMSSTEVKLVDTRSMHVDKTNQASESAESRKGIHTFASNPCNGQGTRTDS